jgi:hypothetical protein
VKPLPRSMRRAALTLGILLVASVPLGSFAARVEKRPDIIDGAGMVNYMQRPNFTVGSWVKYHSVSSSERGFKDDYTVTILIGGEEVWWGEPCFWVETRTEKVGERERYTASLVSYAAFGDTMADDHLLWFIRKTINGLKMDGSPDVALYTRGKNEIQARRAVWAKDDNAPKLDSLGNESVKVPAGSFETFKVRRQYVNAETAEQGDSTVYYERRLDRTFFMTPKVPFTNLAQVTVDDVQKGKTWMAGKFDKGALNILERAQGTTVLTEYGTTGLKAVLVPVGSRRPIDRKVIEATLAEYAHGTPDTGRHPSR